MISYVRNKDLSNTLKSLFFFGELAGIRTRDPLIKSQMLYRLSYELLNWYALY